MWHCLILISVPNAVAVLWFPLLLVAQVGSSISNIYTGIVSHVEDTSIDLTSCAIIISVIVIKALLWHYCQRKSDLSDSVETLASDHFNDVLSNIVAAAAIILTMQFHSVRQAFRLSHRTCSSLLRS